MNKTAQSVWENCLSFIKDNIQDQAYKTWFEPIKSVELTDNALYIQVPSKFFYEWLRNKGISYKWLEENGIMLPVVSLSINYKKPARYDELLTLKTILKKQTSVKIEFDYELFNEEGELLTTGNSILVFVDMKTGRPIAPPTYLFELLNRIEK